jgi:hypothetical protein
MSLDSKQKRGSAMLVSMPFRSWLAEPDGVLASTDRLSLLKLCSAVTPAAPAATIIGSVAVTIAAPSVTITIQP